MRFILILVLAAFASHPLRAALDPETKTTYQLRVIVRVADHPDFTEHFRRELKRELQGNLQAALGNLGTVEIVDLQDVSKDKWEPLWKQVEEKGLESLDAYREIGGGKTHFLRVDFNDGQYDLQARQHDGASGFVTPIVRKASTHARSFVNRLASLMIGQDFGLVATLEAAGLGERAFIKIKANDLGPVDKWVKKGEVFAVVQIRQERRRIPPPPNTKGPAKTVTVQTGSRVDGILLKVIGEPAGGVVPCKVFSRYEGVLPRGGVGFRCVKLGTTEGPLRLQLLDASGAPQKGAALSVHARNEDFPDGGKEGDQATNGDGVFTTKESFSNVALVRVMLGNRRIARIPVEIMDDRVQTRTIRLDPAAETRDRLDVERRGLMTRITDGRLIQVRGFQEITALEQAGKNKDALERGQSVHKLLDALSADMQAEIESLQVRITKELTKGEGFLAECEQQLQILHGKQDDLAKHLASLQVAIAEENDPKVQEKKKKVQDLIRAAELFITQADYDKALTNYEEALAEVQNEPAAKKKIDGPYQILKKAWALKPGDVAHAEARKFIFETWPTLAMLKDIRAQLLNARKSFDKCKAVGDHLSVHKMHYAAVEVATKFGDELKKLSESATEDEEKKTLEIYVKVNEELLKLLKDVSDFEVAGQKK